MNILFITHTRIGDGVLSSGILHHLIETYPDARFTVACGPLAASLFADMPRLDRVIVVTKQRFDGHWYALWKQVRGTVWDIVVDLRRSLISYLVPVRKRYVVGAIPDGVHHVVHLSQLLDLAKPAAPYLYRSERHDRAGVQLIPEGAPVLAVAPVAATRAKTWPPERFADLIARLTTGGGACAGWRVALFGGPGDEISAAPLITALERHGCIKVFAEPDLLTVQAALARCRAFIGNDSGIGHLAAAAGVPTLALFAAADPARYRPWGGAAVQAPGQDLSALGVESVISGFHDLIKSP